MYLYYQAPTREMFGQTWEIAQMNACDVLLQRRKELKLKQQEVAELAGLQVRQYQRLESGERDITSTSAGVLLAVCRALRLDPNLFIGEGNEPPEVKCIVLPPIAKQGLSYVIPSIAYYNLVSAIPRGMVCTDDDLMACLRAAYGMEGLEIQHDHNSAEMYLNDCFPYWRVVSSTGNLVNHFFCSKEKQQSYLAKEGVKAVQVGEQERYHIEDFQYRRFDITHFKITVQKTDEEIMEQFSKPHGSEDK